jgi:uncharacterized protein (TIGR02466 family)
VSALATKVAQAVVGSGCALQWRMSVKTFFPTLVYSARLNLKDWRTLNRRLLRECEQLEHDDEAGRRWSALNYPGGYTSYNSASRMHELSPTFSLLQRTLDRHVQAFTKSLDMELDGRELTMTDCWVNIMPQHVVHGLHLHPLSTISGTYYVQTPKGSPGLKFEDPRLDRFMAAPPRKGKSSSWVVLPAEAGNLVLFESWLRHEVPRNQTKQRRISISFNYGWF